MTPPDPAAASPEQQAEATAFLAKLLGAEPRFVEAARAFFAGMTGAQIREAAASGLFSEVTLDRKVIRKRSLG